MKRILSAAMFIMGALATKAQTTDTTKAKDPVFTSVEQVPVFPGGLQKLAILIHENFKYPKGDTIEGRVYVVFVVEKDGSLSDLKIAKSLSKATDTEALRLIKMTSPWQPGMRGGQPVRVQYALPINFKRSH
ncbi:energy transducer TonB [Mucilaginibacter sp. P25]|uniref:Protein TonB n=1 Tax=Mucilaginibacter gossypii TaxID=551996 RepID=A0A1G7YUZ8_9SPHI|nr:energy transducer TonB [Mucilaginibacter gossypii]SDH00039.1 protein TonB [Mucilaginibacter gossypii]